MRRKLLMLTMLFAVMFMVANCGGGGGGGSDVATTPTPTTPTATTDLHAVFYKTLTNASLLTLNLYRQNGDGIPNRTVTADTRVDSTGNRVIGNFTSKTTDTNGTAYFALPSGTYPIVISSNTTSHIGGLNSSVTITSDKALTYKTSQQSWTVTSSKAFKNLSVKIYQSDSSGIVSWGSVTRPLEPSVLVFSTPTSTTGLTSTTFTTELYKGNYRAVITAAPLNATDAIAPYVTTTSSLISAAGNGATETVPTINLDNAGGNLLTLALYDESTPISSVTASYTVTVYDKASFMPIGSAATNTLGVSSILTGTVTNVLAVVTKGGNIEALKTFTASPSSNEKLTKYPVTGNVVVPSGGSLDATDATMKVVATFKTSLGNDYYDKMLSVYSAPSGTVNSVGAITGYKLFEGSYTVKASITKYPDSDKVTLTINGSAPASQNINVKAGGVITGRIQDQSKNDITGVSVSVWDSTDSTNTVISHTTSTTQGTYTLTVPYGTYTLSVGGALTRNISVNQATVTQNITQFQIQGRLTDSAGSGLAGTVTWGGGSASASSLGTFTLDMYEGENWVWFTPPSSQPSLGFAVEDAVQIDSTTITSN